MSKLFIPEKIHVGFNSRSDTYTKKLAYVIYTDEKGKKRKETSWENWRDKDISSEDYDNTPTEGFVLNKKVGGYKSHWNFRNAYVRVYDPRGFEFEITIENLLFILENTSSIIGKGLEGKFVYSWDGKDLVLLPVNSQNYIESTKYTEQLTTAKKIGARDMEIGKVYFDKSLHPYVFLGRKQGYKHDYFTNEYILTKGKLFWFLEMNKLVKDVKITEEDIEEVLKVYDNRINNIAPFELSYSQRKGSIESFSGVSSKFIQMSDTVDTLALAYGELLLKDSVSYNKGEQECKRKPITLNELNAFAQGVGIENGGFNLKSAYFTPFSKELVLKLKKNSIQFNSLQQKQNNFSTHWYNLWERNRLEFNSHYQDDKKHVSYKDNNDIFETLIFSVRYNRSAWVHGMVDFTKLEFLLEEENIIWVELDKDTQKPLLNENGKKVVVNEFEKGKNYQGIRVITVKEILENLEIEELYHKNHLVRKGIVNK